MRTPAVGHILHKTRTYEVKFNGCRPSAAGSSKYELLLHRYDGGTKLFNIHVGETPTKIVLGVERLHVMRTPKAVITAARALANFDEPMNEIPKSKRTATRSDSEFLKIWGKDPRFSRVLYFEKSGKPLPNELHIEGGRWGLLE